MTSLNLYCYSFVPSTCTLKRLDKAGLWCIEGISDKANFYHSYFYNSLEQKRQNSIYWRSKIFYSLTFFFYTNIIIKKKKSLQKGIENDSALNYEADLQLLAQ